jgi:regulator of sigma E protease
MTVLIFIIVLVVLILVHEFGHFIAAKLCGMRVDEFGIGFPPKLWGFQAGETFYSINALPFGGFVKIHGEDASENGQAPDPRSFSGKPRILQAVVLVAGIVMNIILAWFIFSGLLMTSQWVGPNLVSTPLTLVPALIQGAQDTWNITVATAEALGNFFMTLLTLTANLSQVTGPVGIANAVGQASANGWSDLLTLVALISINLAIINIIPIPALDGGRLLFVVIEGIIRRPLKASISNAVNATGFALLVLLMVVVTLHDVYKLIT